MLLNLAVDTLDALRCGCGCGHPADVAHDESTVNRWQVEVSKCYARETLAEFSTEHKDDLTAGSLMSVRLLPPGQTARDPLKYDPERARREYDALQRRHGVA